jgi:CheY-like chemotaxis protein
MDSEPTRSQILIVIILTSSIYEGDIKRAYDLGANAFLVKPSNSNVTYDTSML